MNLTCKKLDEVCEILDSQRVPITASERKAGQYPYYGANGVQDYVADFIFDDELVLLAEDGGNFGSKERPIAYRVSGKCWVNNHAHVLKPRPEIDVDYLCYALMFYDTTSLVNGATRQKLTQAAMRQMKIPFRSMKEQKTIVQKISAAASLITIRKTQLQKLDQLASSRFIEMFGSSLNDTNYPIIKLNQLSIKISDGVHAKPDYQSTGMPFLSVVNIVRGFVDFTNCKYVSKEAYEKMIRSTNPQKGDVLYTKVGATYGIPAYVDTEQKFCLYVSVCLIKPNHAQINSKFLAFSMGMPYIKKQADARIKGIGVPDLHLNQIREFDIITPPRVLQNEFAAFVEQLDKSKVICNKLYKEVEFLQFRM